MKSTTKALSTVWAFLFLMPSISKAAFSFEGYLSDSSGNAISGAGVTVNLKVRSPGAEDCLLFEESHVVTVANDGYVALPIGSGTRIDALPYTVGKVFENNGTFSGLTCGGGGSTFSPANGDKRKLNVTVTVGGVTENLGSLDINPVPVALSSEKVGGFSAAHLLRVEAAGVPQAATAFNPSQFTELTALIMGTSTQYMKSGGSNGANLPVFSGAPGAPTAGSFWYDSSSNQMKYYDGSAIQTVGGGGGAVTGVTGTTPLVVSGSGALTVSMPAANGSRNGYLSMSDWNVFNNKMGNSLTTGQIWIGNGVNVSVPQTVSGDAVLASGGALTVNGLAGTPLSLGGLSVGQVLRYSGSTWQNQSLSMNDIISGVATVSQGGTGTSANFGAYGVITSDVSGSVLQALHCTMNQVIKFDGAGYAVCGNEANSFLQGGNSFGGPATLGTFDSYPLRFLTNGAEKMVITPVGKVGIGVGSPIAQLQVQGQIASSEYATAGSTADFMMGNSIVLSSVGSSVISLVNMVPGGHYTVVVEDPTSRTYTFGGCTNKFSPANAATTTSTTTIFRIYYRSSNVCYINWQTGYL